MKNSTLLIEECTSFCLYSNRDTSISNKEGNMHQSIQNNTDSNHGLFCDNNNNIVAAATTAKEEAEEQ